MYYLKINTDLLILIWIIIVSIVFSINTINVTRRERERDCKSILLYIPHKRNSTISLSEMWSIGTSTCGIVNVVHIWFTSGSYEHAVCAISICKCREYINCYNVVVVVFILSDIKNEEDRYGTHYSTTSTFPQHTKYFHNQLIIPLLPHGKQQSSHAHIPPLAHWL